MTRYAIVSVTDKRYLDRLGKGLSEAGVTVLSTGNTATAIRNAGYEVTDVSAHTGFPEGMGGRLKTLHPMVEGGILCRRDNADDMAFAAEHGIEMIDLVFVNLYDFGGNPSIEQIDIGGPTMLRAAAKNHQHVVVVVDPDDYDSVLAELAAGGFSGDTRRRLARKAFAHTAAYDAAITTWFDDQLGDELPPTIHLTYNFVRRLTYGENKHMEPAGQYALAGSTDPLALHEFERLAGDPSFVFETDHDRVLLTLTEIYAGFEASFDESPYVAVIVKHGNAAGAAFGDDPWTVLSAAIEGDLKAIHGGVLMTNFEITAELAELLLFHAQPTSDEGKPIRRLIDGVFAPAITEAAVTALQRYKEKCRMQVNPALAFPSADRSRRLRPVRGGLLVQPAYSLPMDPLDTRLELIGTGAPLSNAQRRAIVFGTGINNTSSSNTITYVSLDGRLLSNGVGQQDRVGAAELATRRMITAADMLNERGLTSPMDDFVAVSDSFFPYPDGLEVIADAGAGLVVTTSGSITGDAAVRELANQRGLAVLWGSDGEFRRFSIH